MAGVVARVDLDADLAEARTVALRDDPDRVLVVAHPGRAGGGAPAGPLQPDRAGTRAADLGEADVDSLAANPDEAGALGGAAGAGAGALIREEIEAGRVTGIDPEPTARGLIGMNLQYFFDQLVDRPSPDLEATANTLLVIWQRALYGPGPG